MSSVLHSGDGSSSSSAGGGSRRAPGTIAPPGSLPRRALSAQSPSFSLPLGGPPSDMPRSTSAVLADEPSESKTAPSTASTTFGSHKKASKLSVRLSQPVQGCALKPYTLARDAAGNMIEKDDKRIEYRWLVSRAHSVCAHAGCGRIQGDSQSRARIQCLSCLKADTPPAMSFFCSIACFRDAWHGHRHLHAATLSSSSGSDSGIGAGASSSSAAAGAGAGGGASGRAGSSSSGAGAGAGADYHDLEAVDAFASALGPVEDDAWEEVSTGPELVPQLEHVWHKLRLEVSVNVGGEGSTPLTQTATTKWVLPMPPDAPHRPFLPPTTAAQSPESPAPQVYSLPPPDPIKGDRSQPMALRIMSFNVLAEIYATQSMYPYCPLWALRWPYRRKRLIGEIERYDPDILCLQEVQADHFESFLYPTLASMGYEGLYKQKTREPMGLEGKVDGCALFFRTSRFNLLEKYVIEFNDAAMAESQKLKNMQPIGSRKQAHGMALHRLLRDNVAQVVLLEMHSDSAGNTLPSPVVMCVANTHLFWDPEYADVKLWQTHMLVKELEKFTYSRELPLVLCGDFNSAPGSAVHKLLCGNALYGRLRAGLSREDLPRDPCSILPGRGKLSHQLFLSSAYAAAKGSEPKFTNFTGDFVGCLDYVWFTSDSMRVTSWLKLPDEAELRGHSNSALPNTQHCSDHLSLCFDMVLRQPHYLPLSDPMPPAGAPGHGAGGAAGVRQPPLPQSPPPMPRGPAGLMASMQQQQHQAAAAAAAVAQQQHQHQQQAAAAAAAAASSWPPPR